MGPCILGLISPPGLLQPVFISLMGMMQGLFFPSLHKKGIGQGCETGGNCWGWSAKSVDSVGKHRFLISISASTEELTRSGRKQGVTLHLRGIHWPGISPFAEQFISWAHTALVAESIQFWASPNLPDCYFWRRPKFLAI